MNYEFYYLKVHAHRLLEMSKWERETITFLYRR